MNPDYVIVDLQGFKDSYNSFIVKEFALATKDYTQVFLVKPPHPYCNLPEKEKKQVSWIQRQRGIFWSEGYMNLHELKRVVIPFLAKKKVFVKGTEKAKWLFALCLGNCQIIDIGDEGCPSFLRLNQLYNNDANCSFNCVYHKKHCALKNVVLIKTWFTENNMQIFKFNDIGGKKEDKILINQENKTRSSSYDSSKEGYDWVENCCC